MADTKYLANKRRKIAVALVSGNPFAALPVVTVTEANALKNISEAVRANGETFGVQATPATDDRSWADDAAAQGDGFVQFGGDIPVYTPTNYADTADILQQVWALTKAQGTELWVMTSLGPLNSAAYVANQFVSLFKVKTDGSQHNTEGVGGRVRVLTFQPNGDVFPNILLGATSPTAITATAATTATVGSAFYGNAVLGGINVTRDVTWTSSNTATISVAESGVFVALAAGTATLTASYPGATASTPISVTVA